MEIIIFRHADKDFSSNADPGLSIKGHKQAEKITKAVKEKRLPQPQELWVSPKQRALETFEPLQELLQIPITVHPQLDQRLYEESSKQFTQRVRSFIEKTIPSCKKSTLFVCTHSDWIETIETTAPLAHSLDFQTLLMPSSSYLHFEVLNDGKWKLLNKSGFDA